MHHAHNSFVKDLEQAGFRDMVIPVRQVEMHYNIMQKIYIVLGHVH